MKHYRVNIFAKVRRGPEIYQAKPTEAADEAAAKAIAEAEYRRYESWATQAGSKHPAVFYELLEGDKLVYSSSPLKSVLTAFLNLIFFRRSA
jgi:hypothetical protein